MELLRPEKSSAEIAALPALGTTQCLAHVRLHGPAFAAETIVYLLRKALDLHDALFFELCARLLVGSEQSAGYWQGGHCEGVVVNLAKSFGFLTRAQTMREFRTRCHSQMWKAIHDGGSFWEMRFGMAFRRKCIEVARALVRDASEGRRQGSFSSTSGGANPDVDQIAHPEQVLVDDEVAARLSNPIHQGVVLAAVRRLPRRQGAAALLAWIEKRSIEGSGSGTVSTLMGITPRGVRLLLAKARRTLQTDPAIRAIWFGEA